MEKHVGWLLATLAVLSLLVGGLVGYNMTETEVITKTETVYQDVPVEVEVSVNVPFPDASLYLDLAVEDFMEHVEDQELFVCGKHEYDYDEISISRVYDEYSVSFDRDDYIVDFSIKLKYDEDGQRSCRQDFDVTVEYLDDEIEVLI